MIREMKITDLDSVKEIEDKSFNDGIYSIDQFKYELKENPFSKCLISVDDNKINGYLIYMVTFNSSSITKLAVHPLFRKKGVATNLVNKMVEQLLSKGYGEIENITLEVRSNNKSAYSFYKKNKFKDVTIKKKYYDNGDDAIYMMRILL